MNSTTTNHSFSLINADTDGIVFAKPDGSEFKPEEVAHLVQEINSLLPEYINFGSDGVFSKIIVLRAKNYVMVDERGKVTIKGSALKSSKTEIALKEFLDSTIQILLEQDQKLIDGLISRDQKLVSNYNKYVQEIMNVSNIKRWSSKKSITQKILTNTRTNEAKIRDAIQGSEYVEGDKCWVYFKNDNSLCLIENFDGVDYNKKVLLKKLYKISLTFDSVLDCKSLFMNYALKKNYSLIGSI